MTPENVPGGLGDHAGLAPENAALFEQHAARLASSLLNWVITRYIA